MDSSIKCQTNPSENILPSEQMGFLISEMGPANKSTKDTGLSTPARYRERRSNSQGKSPGKDEIVLCSRMYSSKMLGTEPRDVIHI